MRRFSTQHQEDDATSKEYTSRTGANQTTRARRGIRTLDPTRLTPDDYLDFSLLHNPTVHVILRPPGHASTHITGTPSAVLARMGAAWDIQTLPQNTRGFLYYHLPAHSPPHAGELRFRLTPSSDPATFAAGSDLTTERSTPWSFPLLLIVRNKKPSSFCALLLQDGLISQRTLRSAIGIGAQLKGSGKGQRIDARTRIVSAFGQPFYVQLGPSCSVNCLMLGATSARRHLFRNVATVMPAMDGQRVSYSPFQGTVICSFERSVLPEHAHKRVVVLRIHRILDSDPILPLPPPEGRTYPLEKLRPREGELLMTYRHQTVKPWGVDVDKPHGNGGGRGDALRVLFENEELYGNAR